MKLKFHSTSSMVEYHGALCNAKDDDIIDLAEDQAKELLSSFPLNFKILKGKEEKKIFGSKKTK